MVILHMIFSLKVGGAETMLVDIANQQALNNKVFVCIINRDYSPELISKFNKEIVVNLFNRTIGSKNIYNIFRLNLFVIKICPDIIHIHDSNIINMLPLCNKQRMILTVHGVDLPLFGVEKYNSVAVVSAAAMDRVKQKGGKNISIIYNGINTSWIQHRKDKKINNLFNIVQVSRLDHTKKGQHILLEALAVLRDNYKITNFHLDFIGEGESFSFLEEMSMQYGLQDKVSFLGLKDRAFIYAHLQNYDLLVQPSLFEGFGLTVAEGMAAKIPVLVSDRGPIEIIEQGKYGYFFERGNVEECALKIKEIMESPNSIHCMTESAYTYCLNKFDIKNTVKSYFDLYEQIIK